MRWARLQLQTTGPDSVNNVMVLALGILIVGGSLWIMGHLNGDMVHMPMSPEMRLDDVSNL